MNFFLLISVIFSNCLFALNSEYYFTQYNIKKFDDSNGFPSSVVYSTTQTQDGYLWFGTEAGLVQYNGTNYNVFDRTFFKELKLSKISVIIEDKNKNSLWLGTFDGFLIHFDYKNKTYKILGNSIIKNSASIVQFYYDNDVLIIITKKNDIFSFKDEIFTKIKVPENDLKVSLISPSKNTNELFLFINEKHYYILKNQTVVKSKEYEDVVKNVFIDSRKIKFISFNNYTKAFDENEKEITLPQEIQISGNLLFTEDKNNNIYFYSRLGNNIKRITFKNNSFHFENKKDYYKTNMIFGIFEDKEGSIWISSYGFGLLQFIQSPFAFFSKKEGIKDNIIFPIFEYENKIYTGSISGKIDIIENRIVSNYLDIPNLFNLPNAYIASLCVDNNSNLLISTEDAVFIQAKTAEKPDYLPVPDYLGTTKFPNIVKDSDGNIWITSIDGKLFSYEAKNGKNMYQKDKIKLFNLNNKTPGIFFNTFLEINNEKWFGFNEELGIYILKDERFEAFNFKNKSVSDLYKDDENNIWIISGNELFCYTKNKELININSKNNLPQTELYKIIQDKNNNFWLTSIKGLYFIKKPYLNNIINKKTSKLKYKKYTTDDGLLSHEFIGGFTKTILLSKNGKIYASTTKGIIEIDSDYIFENKIIPNVVIETIKINNISVNVNDNIVLKPDNYEIEFEFKALTYINQQKVKYKYQLVGFDKEFSEETDKNSIRYTNLPYGKYKFVIIASNSSEYWNTTGDSFDFEIKPYYYQKVWFYVIVIIISVLLVYLLFLWRIHRLQKRKEELEKIIELRTKELKEASLKDPLTGLRNRRFFSEILNSEVESFTKLKLYIKNNPSRRTTEKEKSIFGVYIFDIDLFKKINDTYGHDAGDRVLKQFADILQTSVRIDDVVIRWGGEEFLVILKYSNSEYLSTFATNIKNKISSFDFIISNEGKIINITCSIGYISFPLYEDFPEELTFEESIMFADLGLYYSKRNGRNLAVFVKPDNIPDFKDKKWKEYLSSLDKAIENNIIKIELKNQ